MVRLPGISLSSKTGALYMSDNGVFGYGTQLPKVTVPAPPPDFYSISPWSPWGANNRLPIDMQDHIENCGVLNGAIDLKARIAIGKGIMPFLLTDVDSDGKETFEFVDDSEIHDFLEANDSYNLCYDLAYDRIAAGWMTGRYLFTGTGTQRKIAYLQREDVFNARLQKMLPNNTIPGIYLCNDWKQSLNVFDDNYIVQLTALKEGFELTDIATRNAAKEFAFIRRRKRAGRVYYPWAEWMSTLDWVKISRSIPALKQAMFKNQISIKYIVTVSPRYFESIYGDAKWQALTDDERQAEVNKVYDDIENWLTGEQNTYKSIITQSYYDPAAGKEVPYITITAVDDKLADGKFLPDSSAGASEIYFALSVNPALTGAGQPGGTFGNNSGGSNVRESLATQMMLTEPIRRDIAWQFNVVKGFNGWDKRLEKTRTITPVTGTGNPDGAQSRVIQPRLTWRFPSGLLTTLDTGKSTKSENL